MTKEMKTLKSKKSKMHRFGLFKGHTKSNPD